jgi:lysophospholipase
MTIEASAASLSPRRAAPSEADAPETDADPPAQPSPLAGSVLFVADGNPLPVGTASGYFDGQDLTRLRYARWEATAVGHRGTVCLFTGRAEFIEKYFETVAELRARGFEVAMMDWRGQGGSARMLGNPYKGHVTTFEQYLADIDYFMRDVVLPDCRGPYFALAHSMGSNIVMQVLARRTHWFDRAVLVSPMLSLAGLPLSLGSMRRLAEIFCYAGFAAAYVPGGGRAPRAMQEFDGNPFTSDRHRFERNLAVMRAAPEIMLGAPTIGWFHAAARAMEVVLEPEFTPLIRVPLLLVGAGRDSVVSTATIEEIGSGLRGGGFVVVDGARHEILQERDWLREQFWAAFDTFIPGSR